MSDCQQPAVEDTPPAPPADHQPAPVPQADPQPAAEPPADMSGYLYEEVRGGGAPKFETKRG
jgi:hypothetical protein